MLFQVAEKSAIISFCKTHYEVLLKQSREFFLLFLVWFTLIIKEWTDLDDMQTYFNLC